MPARLDFAAIAERTDIHTVASTLKLTRLKDRYHCPACDSERAIELFTDTNTFACYAAPPPPGRKHLGGDIIGLWAHIKGYDGMYRAAKDLQELFGTPDGARTDPATAPQKPEARTARAQPAPIPAKAEGFDPAAFAGKLGYTEEVAALGITQTDADALGIGFYRGKLYQALRYANGECAGYSAFANGELKLPAKLLPQTSNVVQLKRA